MHKKEKEQGLAVQLECPCGQVSWVDKSYPWVNEGYDVAVNMALTPLSLLLVPETTEFPIFMEGES